MDVISTFLCQHPEGIGIAWMVNGTALIQIDPRPLGIIRSTLSLNNMGNVQALNVTALSEYNGTEIRCVATLLDLTAVTTEPATLTVQGDWNYYMHA